MDELSWLTLPRQDTTSAIGPVEGTERDLIQLAISTPRSLDLPFSSVCFNRGPDSLGWLQHRDSQDRELSSVTPQRTRPGERDRSNRIVVITTLREYPTCVDTLAIKHNNHNLRRHYSRRKVRRGEGAMQYPSQRASKGQRVGVTP
jgi:hypothetical protein